jgi:hypothetical protein
MSDTKKDEETADSGLPGAACSPSLESLKGLKGKEYIKAWNNLNRDRVREQARAWRKRNPEKAGKVPKEVRDAWRAEGKRVKYNEKYYAQWEAATMRREPWGEVEDCMVMDRKASDTELASQLGRSVRAIQIRRCRLTKQNLEENS